MVFSINGVMAALGGLRLRCVRETRQQEQPLADQLAEPDEGQP